MFLFAISYIFFQFWAKSYNNNKIKDLEESYRGHLRDMSSYHTPSTTQQQQLSAIHNNNPNNNNSDQASNHSDDSETHKNISSCHSDSSSVEDISMWPSESADLTADLNKTQSAVNGSIPTPADLVS